MSARRSLPTVGALIAATAPAHGPAFVARNLRDVAGIGVAFADPWRNAWCARRRLRL